MTFVQMLGWLHTKSSPKATKTRGQQMPTHPLPDLGPAAYLVEWLLEVGLDLTWSELSGWISATQTPVTGWEAAAMMKLSRQYRRAVDEYSGKMARAPWADADAVNKGEVADQVRQAFRRK